MRLPSPPVSADDSPPLAKLTGATQKLGKKVALGIACSDEDCEAATTASVRIPKLGAAKARTYRLPRSTRTIGEGRTVTIHLSLSSAARRAIRRALRAGKTIVVRFRVSVADEAGNTRTLTRQIRLRI